MPAFFLIGLDKIAWDAFVALFSTNA